MSDEMMSYMYDRTGVPVGITCTARLPPDTTVLVPVWYRYVDASHPTGACIRLPACLDEHFVRNSE